MERWRQEKETRNPGCLWLRSLRPPDIHLASRQRAVIHTAGERPSGRRIRFSPDSLRVGDGHNWWSVDTGIKFVTPSQPASEPRSREDKLREVSPDGRTVVVLGEDSAFRVLDAVGNTLATTPPLKLVRPPVPAHLSYMNDRSIFKKFPDTQTVLANARIIFSPDGSAFAVHGQVNWSMYEHEHGYWGVWETRTGTAIVPLQQFECRVQDVMFSPDSRYAALAAGDPGDGMVDCEQGLFTLWDLADGAAVIRHGPSEQAYTTGVAFSPAGDRVFAWGGVQDGDFDYGLARGYIGVWETTIGRQLYLQEGGDRSIWCFNLSSDGTRFAVGLSDGRIGLGDYATLEIQLLTGHLGAVASVAFAPAGTLLASLGEDGTIRLLDLLESDCDPGRLHDQTSPLAQVLFSHDGSRAVTKCARHSVWIWDTRTGEVVARPRPGGVIIFVGGPPPFFFDGRSLVLEGSNGLRVLDAISGEVMWKGPGERDRDAVALGHRQNLLATASFSRDSARGEIVWLDGSEPAVQFDLPVDLRHDGTLTFSADDRWLAAQDHSGRLAVYDAATGERRFSLPGPGPFLFSPDARHILAAGVEPLRLWEVESGVEAARQPVAAWWAREAVSPDGRLRATVSAKGVTVVEPGTGRKLPRLKGHKPEETELAFTCNAGFLLTRDSVREIRLWNLETGQEVLSDAGREGPPNISRADGVTTVRHPLTGDEILIIRDGPVLKAAVSPDGQRVIFVTEDEVTRTWDVEPGKCSVLARRSLPVDAIAAGHRYCAAAGDRETAIIDMTTGQEVAWFPVPFHTTAENFAAHPHGRMWGGGNENRFYLFSLEGPQT
jgi:WD40 repeat protein